MSFFTSRGRRSRRRGRLCAFRSASAISVCSALLITGVISANRAVAANVSVNLSETHQTIDGFGAFGSMPRLRRKAGNFWAERPDSFEIKRFITDLGASAVRFQLPPTVYPEQGQPYDWAGAVFGSGGMTNTFRLMREFKKLGTDRFIFSVWSPPCWMKKSGECNGPEESSLSAGRYENYLKFEHYDTFAEFLADFCKAVKDSVGVEPYAISCQNEPYFHEPYNSCVYTDDNLNSIINKTRAAFDAAGISTKIYGAEGMLKWNLGRYPNVPKNGNLYAHAVHGYTDGVAADPGSAQKWVDNKNAASGKKVWMTETTGPKSHRKAAEAIMLGLLHGNVSLWTWWAYADNLGAYGETDGVPTSFEPHGCYWASKHFFRFIRPGAVRVSASSSDNAVWATAFKNPDNSVAIVLINTASSATTVDVSGSGLPGTWQVYQTSPSKQCTPEGTSNGSNVSMDLWSVVTLYSGDAIPELGTDPIDDEIAEPTPTNRIGELTVKGDDSIGVWLNGTKLVFPEGEPSSLVSLRKGENTIACRVRNTAWGGGMLASMLLPNNDTLRTDRTWRATYKKPPEDWTDGEFDDSQWYDAAVVGDVEDWPQFQKWGSKAVNLYYQKAKWLSGPFQAYFRKEMNVSQSTVLKFRGNNVRFKFYVDGVEKASGTFDCPDKNCHLMENAPTAQVTIPSGNHTFAIEAFDVQQDGNGVLLKGYLSQLKKPFFDTTWKCWFEEQSGWKTSGFDDGGWIHPDIVGAYDPIRYAEFIYPNTFWYRKTFTSSEGTEVKVSIVKPQLTKPALGKVEYFNLRGQRVLRSNHRASLKTGQVLLRKDKYTNGAGKARKVMTVK